MQHAKYTRLAALLLLGTLFLPAPSLAAAGPGAALRQYLAARWRGDTAAAEKLWDAEDLRRSQALGTNYPGLEARFDDNLLWSAAERTAAAQAGRPAFGDSSLETTWARYAVVLPSEAARADTVQYWLRKSGEEWRVASPYARLATTWTLREGRFFRLYTSKLRSINKDALQALDDGIGVILDRLEASELARLRLERIKIEFYLCDTDAELRQLGVQPASGSYRLAGERVVTRQAADLAAASRVLVHLVLKAAPPFTTPLLGDGLAAALGGFADASASVTLQRGIALGAKQPADFESVLDPKAIQAMKSAAGVPLAATWSETLRRELGATRFLALYRAVSGPRSTVAALDAAAVRAAIESATGKRGPALATWVRARSTAFTPLLAGGCDKVPVETQGHPPVLRWRDTNEHWALEVHEVGDDYVFVVGPYQGGTPQWARRLMDSLTVARGEKPDAATQQPRPRPPGDPPQLAILIRERFMEAEAYESGLYHQQFSRRAYAGDVFGLFISPDETRLFDYRRDLLVGYHGPSVALSGAPPYYDAAAGRLCFRLRRSVLSKPLAEYMAVTVIYTGE